MDRLEALSIMNVIIHMIEPQYDNDRVEEAVQMAIRDMETMGKIEELVAEYESEDK